MFPYQDPTRSITERADDLVSRMTAEEKIGQLCKIGAIKPGFAYTRAGNTITLDQGFQDRFAELLPGTLYGLFRADWWTARGWGTAIEPRMMADCANLVQRYAIEHSRLGIPLLFAEEAPHGIAALGCTVFPTGIGLGATWNADLAKRVGEVIGDEAAAAGIHTCFGPVLDMIRDPRWSRAEENFSEDPWLTAMLGKAWVEGMQAAAFPLRGRPFATLKHFAAHGDPEGGHNSAPTHVGPIEFRNLHLLPFEHCVRAGARALMSAYNTIDGVPCAANRELLTGILRGEWGFDGIVMADGGGISRLKWQRFGATEAEISAMVLKAGLDNSSVGCGTFHAQGLRDALAADLIDEADLDEAVQRTLRLKFRLGVFDSPYVAAGSPAAVMGSTEYRAVALEAARQSLTLLANKGSILPLENIARLAVIGPNANTPMNQLGDYTAPQKREDIITTLDGIQALAAKRGIEVDYAKGCKVRSLCRDLFEPAIEAARKADAVVLVLGGSSAPDSETGFLDNGAARINEVKENPEYDKESGEGYDRARLRFSGLQLELLRRLKELGKPVVTVLVMGRPLIVNEVAELSDAVLVAWYPGMMGGQAIAEAVFGEYNPGGRLPLSFPLDEAQLPIYYDSHMPRDNYIDMQSAPRFSFGYGLSYTTFAYSDLTVQPQTAGIDDAVTVSVTVTNSGDRDGDEVVQLYVTDRIASVGRPFRELRGFQRIHLAAGERRTVTFSLGCDELGFYNRNLVHVVEPGTFTIAVGGTMDSLLQGELTVDRR